MDGPFYPERLRAVQSQDYVVKSRNSDTGWRTGRNMMPIGSCCTRHKSTLRSAGLQALGSMKSSGPVVADASASVIARIRQVFTHVAQSCATAGIAKGEVVYFNATLICADIAWEGLGIRQARRSACRTRRHHGTDPRNCPLSLPMTSTRCVTCSVSCSYGGPSSACKKAIAAE